MGSVSVALLILLTAALRCTENPAPGTQLSAGEERLSAPEVELTHRTHTCRHEEGGRSPPPTCLSLDMIAKRGAGVVVAVLTQGNPKKKKRLIVQFTHFDLFE